VVLLACDTDADREPLEPQWHEAALPDPSGPPGRIALRDAVNCGGVWTAVGGVFLAEPSETRDSRPAAWRSSDGVTWTALDVAATTYWGRRAILSTVACASDQVVAVGARSGGAHGYPRVTSFFEKNGGLDDQRAVFNLYGGDTATNVGPITGADPGWLITGNRVSGPAVWHSTDGRDFVIEEGVPGLADEEGFTALAQAATWDGDHWVVVGGGNERSTLDREPLAWVSPDATSWERHDVPGTKDFDDLERVIAVEDDLVALGLRGDGFGVWRREAGDWSMGDSFGVLADDPHASPFVSSLVTGDRGLWATTSDGASYALWHSTDGDAWAPVASPAAAPETGGDRILTVAADDETVLLLADEGTGGRLWWSTE
jgi:hypothetical protein